MSKTSEKVLLHLEKFGLNRGDFVAPVDITQRAMAQALKIDRANLSRVLSALEKEELITSDRRHVKEEKRRVKVYFITEHGVNELNKMREKGYISSRVIFGEQMPRVPFFYGREEEMEAFNEWYQSVPSKIMVVKGIAGIGKTAFVGKAMERLCEESNIFWYRFDEWSGVKPLLLRLSAFLSEMGKKKLSWYLENREFFDIGEISLLLEEDLQNVNAILVFDDYHKAQRTEIKELFGSFVTLLPRLFAVKMVVLGREVTRFHYDIRDIALSKTVIEIELAGLDMESSEKILQLEKVNSEHHRRIFQMTRGHPLALSLVRVGGKMPTTSMAEYLGDEIISHLSKEEKALLEVASAFRRPAHPTIYLEVASPPGNEESPIDYSVIEGLARKSLFSAAEDAYVMHDLLKSLFYSRIPSNVRKTYHEQISNTYKAEKEEPQNTLEIIHHLVRAEKYEEATRLAVEKGRPLVHEGYGLDLLETLQSIPFKNTKKDQKPRIAMLLGDIYKFQGDNDAALKEYALSLGLFSDIKEESGKADIHLSIGEILNEEDEREEAMENFDKALSISEKNKDNKKIAETLWRIGRVTFRHGENTEALKIMETALENAERSGDELITANILIGISAIMSTKGDYDKGIKYNTRGIDILEKVGRKYELTRAYNVLGTLYGARKMFKEAIEAFTKAIHLSEEGGNARNLSLVLTNVAEAYSSMDDVDTAIEYCDRAIVLAEKMGEKPLLANNNMVYGIIYHKKEDWKKSDEYFKSAIDTLKGGETPYILEQIYVHYAPMLVDADRKEDAIKAFKEALKISTRLENTSRAKMVEKELKKLQ